MHRRTSLVISHVHVPEPAIITKRSVAQLETRLPFRRRRRNRSVTE